MLERKERQMVLDYLYQECIKNSKDSFVTRRQMTCKLESKWKYETLSDKQKNKIYHTIIQEKIKLYLEENVLKSLAIDSVNGSPEKRRMRIQEWADNKYRTMSKAEKVAICEILGFKYISG